MTDAHLDQVLAIGTVRTLVRHRAEVDRQLREAVDECRRLGVDGLILADVLGLSRATLYRQYPAQGRRRRDGGEAPERRQLDRDADAETCR